jgi:hypothetical protein
MCVLRSICSAVSSGIEICMLLFTSYRLAKLLNPEGYILISSTKHVQIL